MMTRSHPWTLMFAICLGATALPAKASDCKSLAERYAKDDTRVSDGELAELRTCVSELLRSRQQQQVKKEQPGMGLKGPASAGVPPKKKNDNGAV